MCPMIPHVIEVTCRYDGNDIRIRRTRPGHQTLDRRATTAHRWAAKDKRSILHHRLLIDIRSIHPHDVSQHSVACSDTPHHHTTFHVDVRVPQIRSMRRTPCPNDCCGTRMVGHPPKNRAFEKPGVLICHEWRCRFMTLLRTCT